MADERYCFKIPEGWSSEHAAPLLCAGIHMSDIPSFPYSLLWKERSVRSVANLTRADGVAFFEAIAENRVETRITTVALEQANEALEVLRSGKLVGAAVLKIGRS